MDRFDAMQAVARLVKAGRFAKAAQTLHIRKTIVLQLVQLVQQMEARLRVILLNRTTRQVKAVADGATCYERAVRLLADGGGFVIHVKS